MTERFSVPNLDTYEYELGLFFSCDIFELYYKLHPVWGQSENMFRGTERDVQLV